MPAKIAVKQRHAQISKKSGLYKKCWGSRSRPNIFYAIFYAKGETIKVPSKKHTRGSRARQDEQKEHTETFCYSSGWPFFKTFRYFANVSGKIIERPCGNLTSGDKAPRSDRAGKKMICPGCKRRVCRHVFRADPWNTGLRQKKRREIYLLENIRVTVLFGRDEMKPTERTRHPGNSIIYRQILIGK